MKLTIVGCGDAFGSGGRLQTCYHLEIAGRGVLIDCGASALIGLNRLVLAPNDIDTVFITHLHGDHFAGLVWLIMHAQHVGRRTAPLTIVGPSGIEDRYMAAAEALFPGSTEMDLGFALQFVAYDADDSLTIGPASVSVREVSHPSGAPSYALRLEAEGRVLAFSGDTEWVDALVDVAAGADLFIIECYGFDADVRYHMNWRIIERNLDRLVAQRVMLTHMNSHMLANRAAVQSARVLLAEDGLVLDV
ncbi:MAG: MBL fold metallo-hydrolase [Hyphomicrobiaceae bacterium]